MDSSPRKRRLYGLDANMACGICDDLEQPAETRTNELVWARAVALGEGQKLPASRRLEKQTSELGSWPVLHVWC